MSNRGRLWNTRNKPWNTRIRRTGIVRRQPDMASPPSGTIASPLWRMSCGKPGAVPKDRRKRIGFMPRNNCEPAVTVPDAALPDAALSDAALEDQRCPKCGAAMEPIENGETGPPLEHLQL